MSQLPSFMEMYRELVATPSVSCEEPSWDTSNRAVIEKLAAWCETLGFRTEIRELARQPGKFNLLATYGQGPGGLLLSGHTDTVPWDEGRWTYDPFQLTEANGKLYGLGTADMKGFFAFVLDVLRDLDLRQLQKPLRILATADEETGMYGARELNKFPQLQPDYAIIGEPTSMAPVRMHKGHNTDCIRVTGRSGHSSNPAAGLNAIGVMHEVIGALLRAQATMQEKWREPAFEVPYPTLNMGHIHGGDAANRICGCCELHLDMRPLPGMSLSALDELLHTELREVQQKYPGAIDITPFHEPIPGYECAADSALVKMVEQISGHPANPANYCTEAPFIDQLGCQTIVMGPGSIAQAHQPDEFITLAEIQPGLDKIRQLIRQSCLPAQV